MAIPTSICRPIVCDSVGMTVYSFYLKRTRAEKEKRRRMDG
jgi:hypothetical protein